MTWERCVYPSLALFAFTRLCEHGNLFLGSCASWTLPSPGRESWLLSMPRRRHARMALVKAAQTG